jgi:hypothetical protein
VYSHAARFIALLWQPIVWLGGSAIQPVKIAFSFVGGGHQFLHGAPVAAVLSRRYDAAVQIFVSDESDARAARDMLEALGAAGVEVVTMHVPRWAVLVARLCSSKRSIKTLQLLWWRRALRASSCIIALERTSTILARLPGRCPPLIHIPHGVGGPRVAKGAGIDDRFSLFDHALLAGSSDYDITIASGLLRADQVSIVGQVKLAGMRRLGKLHQHRLFANGRTTILYNPHFDERRGTWSSFGRNLIDTLRVDGRFNLIVAPHVRLFERMSMDDKGALQALADPNWLIIDTGSPRCCDMTYTLAADIYLGDFSSQLFEWLTLPRPCVFIDKVGDGGKGDSKLPAMWSLGETVTDPDQVLGALLRAEALHDQYKHRQSSEMKAATGDPAQPADEIAAAEILALLTRFVSI